MQNFLDIAIGIIEQEKKILVAERPPGKTLAGYWEFPSSKCNTNESIEQALRRKLYEEVGVIIRQARPLITISRPDAHAPYRLHIWKITHYSCTPYSREHQAIKWICRSKLVQLVDTLNKPKSENTLDLPFQVTDPSSFSATHKTIIRALQLPDIYYITTHHTNWTSLCKQLTKRLEQGIRLIQLRLNLPPDRYLLLAKQAQSLCYTYRAKLLIKGDPLWVDRFDFDGLHLTTKQLMRLTIRPITSQKYLAASCHNPSQLKRTDLIDVDFSVLSPIKPTHSHPHALPIGWAYFQNCVHDCHRPVYALGGLSSQDRLTAWQHGAQGIAGISLL